MTSKKIVLHFSKQQVDKPIVSNLVKDYNLQFNILKAYITPEKEGLMVLELTGKHEDYNKGIEYLKSSGVKIQPLSRDILRNEDKCTDCGVCVTICPTEALVVDSKTREVIFHNDKCIACEACVKICPPRAMEVHF